MRRVTRVVCLGLLVLSWGIATSPTLGDDNKNQANWDRLKQLSAGEEIQVVETDAKSNRGSFQNVSDQSIVVSTATGQKTVGRSSILRVSTRGQKHRMRNALIGGGIGAGVGLGIGAAADAHNNKCAGLCFDILPNGGKEIATPLGAIIGAIVGAVIPTGDWHEVYRAR
jgi:hypothetical protein